MLKIKKSQSTLYVKVNAAQRTQLIQLVFKQSLKIKEAAFKLKIKYATAKSIIAKARRLRNKIDKSKNKKECQYKPIENRVPKWTIISLSFGILMNQISYV